MAKILFHFRMAFPSRRDCRHPCILKTNMFWPNSNIKKANYHITSEAKLGTFHSPSPICNIRKLGEWVVWRDNISSWMAERKPTILLKAWTCSAESLAVNQKLQPHQNFNTTGANNLSINNRGHELLKIKIPQRQGLCSFSSRQQALEGATDMATAGRDIVTSIGMHVTASDGCIFINNITTMTCFSKKKNYIRIQP